jgi:hypothetical protein
LALLVLTCFCEDFFWLDFGDLSPITFISFCGLTCLRHESFSAGKSIVLAGLVIVNDGREFVWRTWGAYRPAGRMMRTVTR